MLAGIETEQPPAIAVKDRTRRQHLRVKSRAPRHQAVEDTAMPVGPIHHRGYAKSKTGHFAMFIRFINHLPTSRGSSTGIRFGLFSLIFESRVQQCRTEKDMLYRAIISRTRKDGSTAYLAQILIKRKGKIVFRQSETFDRRQAAKAWLSRRETELRKPGALDQREDTMLSAVIDRYIEESRHIGKTKAQVLGSIKNNYDISATRCSEIDCAALVDFAKAIPVSAQTRQNYLSHLGAVFAVARPAWRYPLDQQALKDAMVVLKKLGLTGKSKHRDRRPDLEELDRLMTHFEGVQRRRPSSIPMTKIVAFAIFSTRRQEEITLIAWADFDQQASRVLVRDMKDPGEKDGNDVYCDVPPVAQAIISSMPKRQSSFPTRPTPSVQRLL